MHRAHRPWIGSGPSFVVAFALLAPGSAGADTYHAAPTGNDADPGGVDYPWATLQHAADWVRPGDEVLVADGEYTGFRLTTAGTAAAPIAFRAAADAAVINAPPVPDGPGIMLQDTAWVTIEGFRITSVPAAGIHASSATGSLQGIVVRGNEIDDVGGEAAAACIVLVHAADVMIEANVLHGCAGAGIDLPSAEHTRVQNNIVYGTGGGGILSSGGDRIPGPNNLVVANNTVHVPDAGGWALRIAALGGVGTGNAVFNNILLSDDAAGGSIVLEGDVGFASARNAGVDRFSTDDGATTFTLAQFQASGYELGSITSDATGLFVDGSMGDYRIRAGCPAVNWGVPELNGNAAPAFDIRGTPRPVGPSYDLGAYEFCAGWTCGGADGDADADADGGADADAPSDARPDGSTGGDDGGGCGCRAGGDPAAVGSWLLAIGAAAVLFRRRRGAFFRTAGFSLRHRTPKLPGAGGRGLKPAVRS